LRAEILPIDWHCRKHWAVDCCHHKDTKITKFWFTIFFLAKNAAGRLSGFGIDGYASGVWRLRSAFITVSICFASMLVTAVGRGQYNQVDAELARIFAERGSAKRKAVATGTICQFSQKDVAADLGLRSGQALRRRQRLLVFAEKAFADCFVERGHPFASDQLTG
jgi:hypothetical protein